jgi:hypothetical protein
MTCVMILRVPPNWPSGGREISQNAQTPRRDSVLEPSDYETESESTEFRRI